MPRVRTVVVSDLHLGAGHGSDLLRREFFRERLQTELADAERIVLLGDVVELRDTPLAPALDVAGSFFAWLGGAVAGAQIVVVPGNHDHHLISAWLEHGRLRPRRRGLGLEQIARPGSGALGTLARTARKAGAAEVVLAYPGLWLNEAVYATHGHYLDSHLTVPTFERLGVGLVQRILGIDPESMRSPDDYERVQAPLYAFLYALAQSGGAGGALGSNPSARVWAALSGGGGPAVRIRSLLLGSVALPGAVRVANRLRLGKFSPDLSLAEISRAGVRAMERVVGQLAIEAEHLIFGHTHRRGPLAGDGAWTAPGGVNLHNAGSWVWSPGLVGKSARGSGFWPGTVATVEAGAPTLTHLLDDLERERLAEQAGPGDV
jgi:UDP-2,3-diacylglucosamine pyrophosphatase LpxH